MQEEIRAEKWSIVRLRGDGGDTYHLTGISFGHPCLDDGHALMTTPIVALDVEGGVCRTLNTEYVLGLPCSKHEFRAIFYPGLKSYFTEEYGRPFSLKWVTASEWERRHIFAGLR